MALREHLREVDTAATRSTPVLRTDHINTYTYGHGDGHDKYMLSFDEFPAIDIVKSGKNGSVGVAGIWNCGCSAQMGSGSGSRSADVGRDKSHVVRFEDDVDGVGGSGAHIAQNDVGNAGSRAHIEQIIVGVKGCGSFRAHVYRAKDCSSRRR